MRHVYSGGSCCGTAAILRDLPVDITVICVSGQKENQILVHTLEQILEETGK